MSEPHPYPVDVLVLVSDFGLCGLPSVSVVFRKENLVRYRPFDGRVVNSSCVMRKMTDIMRMEATMIGMRNIQ